MVLTIYGFRGSTCTRRVALICKELNLPYEVVDVNLIKGEQRSPEHLARQPFGLVPTISVRTLDIHCFSALTLLDRMMASNSLKVELSAGIFA